MEYLYEYKLIVEDSRTCGNWSNWQKDEIKATDLVKVQTKEVEEIVTEQKEFQSAEEVIYGEMPQRTEEDNETKEEMDSTKE